MKKSRNSRYLIPDESLFTTKKNSTETFTEHGYTLFLLTTFITTTTKIF